MTDDVIEVRGVRLGALYRDKDGELWKVIALCTEPTATVERVHPSGVQVHGVGPGQSWQYDRETHVIGCRNWDGKWSARLVDEPT